jgi:hypothetical protein
MDSFENVLSVPVEDIEIELRGFAPVPRDEYLLNPRRLRGSDFLMRWSQGVWSEKRIVQAVNESGEYFALEYGPSGTAPEDDVAAYERYFLELEQAGLGSQKRPDLLVFREVDKSYVLGAIETLGGISRLPFTPEDQAEMRRLIAKAILGIECENSLWRAQQMPAFGLELTPQRRLAGRRGLPRNAVVPTVILKEEDRAPLRTWQRSRGLPIHIWHVFYDMAFGIAFDETERLIRQGLVEPTKQVFQAPNGITTTKIIYKIYYHYSYPVGNSREEPELVAVHLTDKNGHILPFVRFDGGALALSPNALRVLRESAARR